MHEPLLAPRTSLGLGGVALAEISLEQTEDCAGLARVLDREGGRPLALGRGSNLLFADGRLEVVLVRPGLNFLQILEDGKHSLLLEAASGVRLQTVHNLMLKQGLSGLEGLVGVPASLGGAVAMNAGAFGQDLGKVLQRVQIWSPETGLQWLQARELELGYRSFRPQAVQGFWLLLSVELELEKRDRQQVGALMRNNYRRKKATQPLLAKTCGCVFRNPPGGESAGYLLQSCGLKGFRLGGVGFSSQHANFLVHHGGGSSQQALELIQVARARVWERYGLELELELRIQDRAKTESQH